MNDYDRIAKVVRYVSEHYVEQPNLDELARKAGWSRYHFHREFTKWMGITPKDFVQCLTLEKAKALMLGGESVLDAAIDVGLSGPSRLHDLCVTLEAATPGELKEGGRGLTLTYGQVATPFGLMVMARSDRGICHLAFQDDLEAGLETIKEAWPQSKLIRDDQSTAKAMADVFQCEINETCPLRIWVKGSAFQVRVWKALLQVPRGRLISYGSLAKRIEAPKAARAVGSAVAANPIAYLIPCHRVIRESGVLGNYRWQPERKRALLAWETANFSDGIFE